jgi:hypothetical protein
VAIGMSRLRTTSWARAWFGLTALVVVVGLVVQLFATADVQNGRFAALHSRLFNVFCFFTVQSNIIVGVTCLLLALQPDRRSAVFRVLRLDGLVFGPRGWVTWRVVRLSLIFPICWLVFTLVRGPIVSFYRYPFLDVDEHGYPRVLLSSVVVAILFVGLGALARVTDGWLDRRVALSASQASTRRA